MFTGNGFHGISVVGWKLLCQADFWAPEIVSTMAFLVARKWCHQVDFWSTQRVSMAVLVAINGGGVNWMSGLVNSPSWDSWWPEMASLGPADFCSSELVFQ